jgi:hypothetical protein
MAMQGDLQSKLTSISEQLIGGDAQPQDPPREEAELESEAQPSVSDGSVTEAEGAATPEGEAPTAEEIRTITELAAALEVEPEFLYGLRLNLSETGPDGKPVSLSLGEVKDKLQEYERSRGEVTQQREQLTQERQQFMQQAQQLFAGGQRLQQDLIDARARVMAVVAQRDSIDWGEFERLDPGRAALEKQKYAEALQSAGQHYQKVEQTLAQQSRVVDAHYRQAQDQALLEKLPAWRDREVALREANAIGEWASKTYGYTPQDLSIAVDWQHRDILRKAYLYDAMQAKVQQTRQHVQQAPKTMKPGAGIPRSQLQGQKIAALKERARTSGKKDDQIAAARAILDKAFASRG